MTTRFLGITVLVAAAVSCGDVSREGRSPSYLIIDSLSGIRGGSGTKSSTLISDVITNVTSPAPCSPDSPCPTRFGDSGEVALRLALKNTGPVGTLLPTSNNEVTITRYHVKYYRADGRNVPGVDVPFPFDGAATVNVSAGPSILGFVLVRNTAKAESPLIQLLSSRVIVTMLADVTFYGRDRVGNDINVTGSIQIDVGNFGD